MKTHHKIVGRKKLLLNSHIQIRIESHIAYPFLSLDKLLQICELGQVIKGINNIIDWRKKSCMGIKVVLSLL